MSDNPLDQPPEPKSSGFLTRRTLVIALVVLAVGVIAWTVLKTEVHVADLRSRGFTDVAIDSARDHAYFPLIGGIIGSVSFMLIWKLIRRAFSRGKQP